LTTLTAIKKYNTLPGLEQKLLFRGMLVYCYASILIKLIPVRFYRSLLHTYENNNDDPDITARKVVVRTIMRIKRYFPLKSSCLLLSIITVHLSKITRIHCRIRYSLRINSERKMMAHSYVVFSDGYTLFRNMKYRDIN